MSSLLIRLILIGLASSLLGGCLVRRTVTTGGQTVEDGYAIKRPIKDAIKKGQ